MYTSAIIVSPLLFIIGFNIFKVVFDIMHVHDLGVLQPAVASSLWELTDDESLFPGSTRDERFAAAWRHYSAWCKEHRVPARAKKFKPRKFKKAKEWATITQQTMKAAATRSFQYYLEYVCSMPEVLTTPRAVMRGAMWKSFCDADRVLRRAGKWPTEEEKAKTKQAFLDALAAYAALHDPVRKLYHKLPKGHALMHIACGDFGLNPRKTSCYQDEDQVGRCKRIYQGCHAMSAPRRSIWRYIICMGLRWMEAIRQMQVD